MKRIIIFIVAFSCLFSARAFAFDISEIKPDDSFVCDYGRDVSADNMYLEAIANGYKDRFIVEKQEYIDMTPIESFFGNLFAPLTLSEIDSGSPAFSIDKIYMSESYRKKLNMCKVFGGLSDYSAEFEPTAFFSIHRNVSLIGGYIDFRKTFNTADEAYWQYICSIENLTKEVVPYETRLKLLDKERELFAFIENNRAYVIFLITDGNVDGIYFKE